MFEKKRVVIESPRGPVEVVGADVSGQLTVNWSATNCGFGQLYLHVDPESGRLMVDNECMSREFVSAVLHKMVLDAVFTDQEELVKKVEQVSLEQAKDHMAFGPHRLLLPFYTDKVDGRDETEVEMRWHIAGDQVLRVRFEAAQLVEEKCTVDELCSRNGSDQVRQIQRVTTQDSGAFSTGGSRGLSHENSTSQGAGHMRNCIRPADTAVHSKSPCMPVCHRTLVPGKA